MHIDYFYLFLVGFDWPKQLVFPQQNKNLYKPAFLGVSTSVIPHLRVAQKRKASTLPNQVSDVQQKLAITSKQSKEKVLADYAATHVLETQETGKKNHNYPSASALYKGCIMKPRLTAQYLVEESADNVVLFLIRDGWLDITDTSALGALDVQ